MICHTEMPAPRATTSSIRRDRLKKQAIAPISTLNGNSRSMIWGTRHSDISTSIEAGRIGRVGGPPHQVDVVDEQDQNENADEHRRDRRRRNDRQNSATAFATP